MWRSLLLGLLIVLPSASHSAQTQSYDWRTVPFGGGGFVSGLLYHPAQPGLLYARTDVGGMYRFDYEARRWIPLMDGFGADDWDCFGVMTMAVDPNAPDRLYATCGLYLSDGVPDGGVLRSDDRGATWAKTTLKGVKLAGNAMGRGTGERLVVDPYDGNILWLGTPQNGLLKSTDRGVTFSRVVAFTPKSVTTVLVAGAVIYAGSGETGDGLYRSTDGGNTFRRVEGSPRLIPHQMAMAKDGTLYVTFADGLGPWAVKDGAVWKYANGVWIDITPAKPSADLTFGYTGLDLVGERLIVSTSNRYGEAGDDLFLSLDAGQTWASFKAQARHDTSRHPWLVDYMSGDDEDSVARQHMGHWMDAVRMNPFDPEEMVYGTGYGVWMTRNLSALTEGATVDFAFENNNFEETVILGLEAPPEGPLVMAAAGDVAGTGWHDLTRTPSRGLFSPTNRTNQSVAYAALKPSVIVRTVDTEGISGYISFDGADSWQPFADEPEPLKTADWNNHRAGRISISAKGSHMVWVPQGHGAYVSHDGGRTWALSQGWPAAHSGQDPVADKVDDKRFYLYDTATGHLMISRDGGASFGPWTTLPVTGFDRSGQLRAVPGRRGELWLAGAGGLYRLREGQASAIAGVQAWQVTFGKAAPGRAHPAVFVWGKVGGEEGLWRSDDEGANWVRINTDATRFGRMRAIVGDLRQHGVLYIAPDGRGVMAGRPN